MQLFSDRMFRLASQRRSGLMFALVILATVLAACGQLAAVPTLDPLLYAGHLRVASQPLVQIDPAYISSDSEVLVASHVYDYLIDTRPDLTIQPRLAKSWTVSPDGLSYVFTLQEDVRFHDGSPFTARDVVWTFERLRDPNAGLPTSDLYSNIRKIEATGELEVTFTLLAPNAFFLFDLSDNHALILKENTQNPETFNGTGPFIVEQYTPEERMVMQANPDYFIAGQPKLAGLAFIFTDSQEEAVAMLQAGEVDLALRMSTTLFESLQETPGIITLQMPTNGFDLVRLRADRAPGNDPRVIQAMRLATDREALLEAAQQGYGVVGRDTPIGPLYGEYYTEDDDLPERNVALAQALLAEAGYASGLTFDFYVPDSGGRPDLAAALAEQWAEAGIELNIIIQPESTYYGNDTWLEVDLGITSWGSRPYPQFYLDVMLVSGAVWNESHFSDPNLDQLAAIAGTTRDEAERITAYHDIQQLLIERGPLIIPYFFAQFGAISDRFQGFELHDFAGRSDLRTVSLAD